MSLQENILAFRAKVGVRPARVAFLGDSRTAGSSEVTYGSANFSSQSNLIVPVVGLLQGRIMNVACLEAVTYSGFSWTGRDIYEGHSKSGCGMESSAGVLKQLYDSRPDLVVNHWGYNSIALYDAAKPKYTMMARSILMRQLSQGALPIVVTVPRGFNRDRDATLSFNVMLRGLAAELGLPFVDVASKVDLIYPEGLVEGEEIHYSQDTRNYVCQAIAETIDDVLPSFTRAISWFYDGMSDTENKVVANYGSDTAVTTNVGTGMAVGSVRPVKSASNQPGNFSERAGVVGTGFSWATADPGYGMSFSMRKDTGDKIQVGYALLSTGFSVGDELAWVGEFRTSGMSAGNSNFSLTIAQTGGPGVITGIRKLEWDTDRHLGGGRWAPFFIPFKVGAGTTSLQPAARIEISNPDLANCSGLLELRRHGIINLTTGGMLRNA